MLLLLPISIHSFIILLAAKSMSRLTKSCLFFPNVYLWRVLNSMLKLLICAQFKWMARAHNWKIQTRATIEKLQPNNQKPTKTEFICWRHCFSGKLAKPVPQIDFNWELLSTNVANKRARSIIFVSVFVG